MTSLSAGQGNSDTNRFDTDLLQDLLKTDLDVEYRLVLDADDRGAAAGRPMWRVRFDPNIGQGKPFGLDICSEVVVGRGPETSEFVSLDHYPADVLGVSRRHALIRPSETNLFILDLGSTNGTWRNDRSIGVNMPCTLSNGDIIRFGQLEFTVRIIKRPTGYTSALQASEDIADMLVPAARAIMSQLDLNEVLNQALEVAVSLTSSDEASVWLVDEHTGELFLEASKGIDDEQIKRMRLAVTDTLPGKVIETSKPLHTNHSTDGGRIKVKTGYLVDALVYVPLTLGGVTFGVLSAAHRRPGKMFTGRDEKLLTAIAEFAAIAVQNSRLHQATTNALSLQSKVVTALTYALSYDFKNLANAIIGYAGLLESYNVLDPDASAITRDMSTTSGDIIKLINQLLEIATLSDATPAHPEPCSLLDVVSRAVQNLAEAASAKSITLDFRYLGSPYLIRGEAARLARTARTLIENAIGHSAEGTSVTINLEFHENGITLTVGDTGEGIAEDDIPHVYENYTRLQGKSDGQTGVELGLALVWATAEAHRGTASARNLEGGKGMEFTISLPSALRVKPNRGDARATMIG